jgi:hypothetical protein
MAVTATGSFYVAYIEIYGAERVDEETGHDSPFVKKFWGDDLMDLLDGIEKDIGIKGFYNRHWVKGQVTVSPLTQVFEVFDSTEEEVNKTWSFIDLIKRREECR